jgi:phosphoglycerate dehydrogenase-like enzyme
MTEQPEGATPRRLRVGIACSPDIRAAYLGAADLRRLETIADVVIGDFEAPAAYWTRPDHVPELEDRLIGFAADLDVLLVCHGSPFVSAAVIAAAPNLRMIGDLEGDRFAHRIDMDAARAAGIVVVDTTHASSWPVAEWALALMMLGLRKQARIHDVIADRDMTEGNYLTMSRGRELTGRSVGLIGFGHIGWRLRELLVPFRTPILAHDPFAPRELADALDIDFAPLDTVLRCEVVVCLVPATPRTAGMIGERELDVLRADAVFVNVSRGTVVDRAALEAKAALGDAWFGLDAHDPEPIAVGSPLRALPNVFVSPHIAGVTHEAVQRFFALMVDEVERHHAGVEPRAQLTDRAIRGRSGAAG